MSRSSIKSETPLYILMISLHGLIRGDDLELGRDADTGGQTTYVVELAKHLVGHSGIDKVDLLTRRIEDPSIAQDYSRAEESLAEGVRIVRLPCGPKRYLKKELLWPYLDQMVDRSLQWLKQQDRLPDLIHTHYADAGYVGKQLSQLLGVPLVHTGHSLGRPKLERLLASGRKRQAIEKQFHLDRRIKAEEAIVQHASLIVTSTSQEIEEQYKMYQNFKKGNFSVIPPGTDTSRFSPPPREKFLSPIQELVDKYFSEPEKPMILSISRPDIRKNITGLIEAYGSNPRLREMANLLIIAGTRDDVRDLEEEQQKVVGDLLFDVDRYELWGKVAIPHHVSQEEIPEFYRLAAKRKGIFVNSALTEPFGLTLIEAAASGLPIVAPDDGGPRDIINNCHNGILANTLDNKKIAKALLRMLEDKKRWRQWSNKGLIGVCRHYSWVAHVEKYVKEIRKLLRQEINHSITKGATGSKHTKSAMSSVKTALISDIDDTLLGDKQALTELINWLDRIKSEWAFGVATGRSIESTVEILEKHKIKTPDVFITSVGTEIHYGKKLVFDEGWAAHIRYGWKREALAAAMSKFPGLTLQAEENQREFKLSYLARPDQIPPIKEMHAYLKGLGLRAQLIYSHSEFLDVLPIRASKGHAIRYLAQKWNLPLKSFLVAGDSGNDIEMLIGNTLAIVVGNHTEDLNYLKNKNRIYFAHRHFAAGIMEGLNHYGISCAQLGKERAHV